MNKSDSSNLYYEENSSRDVLNVLPGVQGVEDNDLLGL